MGGPVILHIDDDPELPEGCAEALRNDGYELLHTADAEEAIRLASELEIALLLAEIDIRGFDGPDLLNGILTHRADAKLPLLVVSRAPRASALCGEAIAIGARDFLTKPVLASQLLGSIRELAPPRRRDEPEPEHTGVREITGDLAETPVPEVLARMRRRGASGTVTFSCDSLRIGVQLRNGSAVAVLNERQRSKPDWPADASEEEIAKAVAALAESLLFEAFPWQRGSFRFSEKGRLDSESALTITRDPGDLLLAGVVQASPMAQIKERLRKCASGYVSLAESPGLDDVELSSKQRRVLAEASDGRTLADLIRSRAFDGRILYGLWVAGAFELQAVPTITLVDEVLAQPETEDEPRSIAPEPSVEVAAPPAPEPPAPEPSVDVLAQPVPEPPAPAPEVVAAPVVEPEPAHAEVVASEVAPAVEPAPESEQSAAEPVAERAALAVEREAVRVEPAPETRDAQARPPERVTRPREPAAVEPRSSVRTPEARAPERLSPPAPARASARRAAPQDTPARPAAAQAHERGDAAASAPIQTAAPPPPAGDDPEELARTVRELAQQILAEDDFAALDVPIFATDAHVRAAYERRLQEIPEAAFRSPDQELRERALRIRKRVESAYETLNVAETRRQYAVMRQQNAQDQGTRASAARALEAERSFREGRRLLQSKRYDDASAAFGMASHLDPDEGEYLAHLGYALYLTNPEDAVVQREAMEHIANAIKRSPDREMSCVYLGRILRARGETEAARKVFERALRIRSDCHPALQELRLLEMRKRGVLSRLLGR